MEDIEFIQVGGCCKDLYERTGVDYCKVCPYNSPYNEDYTFDKRYHHYKAICKKSNRIKSDTEK
jgi:hypothetical protein